jgi:plasmid maintenance system antidote protein VapI
LKRLRIQRSAILRDRIAEGASIASLARELGITETRVRSLAANNRRYVSADRILALEALREHGEQKRAAAKAAKVAARDRAAQVRLEARAVEGRVLAGRLAAGATREDLMGECGFGRQKLAALLADARRVDAQIAA